MKTVINNEIDFKYQKKKKTFNLVIKLIFIAFLKMLTKLHTRYGKNSVYISHQNC